MSRTMGITANNMMALLFSAVMLCVVLFDVSVEAVELNDLERLPFQQQTVTASLSSSNPKIHLNEPLSAHSGMTTSTQKNIDKSDIARALQGDEFENVCYTTGEDAKDAPDRYCIIDNTPREDLFLILACPTTNSREEYHECACAIGVGNPNDAPNTETCLKCGFCKDSSLAYDCRNIADGNCIGVNCRGECISSAAIEEADLLLDEDVGASASIQLSLVIIIGLFSITFLLSR
jgi:hypothetical protein